MADRDSGAIGSTVPGHYGASGAGLTLQHVTIGAAWNVQGDGQSAAFSATARRILGVALPATPNTMLRDAERCAMWLGPGSWLVVAASELPLANFSVARDALNNAGGAVFDLSASRVVWRVAGSRAARMLNKGCPLDLDSRVFGPGACAQSVFGHIHCLVCRDRDDASFLVLVARSFARDAWHLLCTSSAQYGYDVLPPLPFR